MCKSLVQFPWPESQAMFQALMSSRSHIRSETKFHETALIPREGLVEGKSLILFHSVTSEILVLEGGDT